MAKPEGTKMWTDKIEATEKRRIQRFRKLKEQIRNDDSLPELDRAVLGATGSPEELKRYQNIARKIGGLAGQPIIKIKETDVIREGQNRKTVVREADAGIIAGPVEASLDYWSGVLGDEKEEFSGSTLRVPVSPSTVYVRKRESPICRSSRDEKEMFFDSENSLYDREQKISHINIARICPIGSREHGYDQITEPAQDFKHRIPFGSILIGREAIYASQHFANGVGGILLALEKYASLAESRPELRLAS